jgi:hypothetical protein
MRLNVSTNSGRSTSTISDLLGFVLADLTVYSDAVRLFNTAAKSGVVTHFTPDHGGPGYSRYVPCRPWDESTD